MVSGFVSLPNRIPKAVCASHWHGNEAARRALLMAVLAGVLLGNGMTVRFPPCSFFSF